MKSGLKTDLSKLCRVCTREVCFSTSENLYDQAVPDCPSIYMKLRAVCSQVFVSEDDKSSKINKSCGMPQNVCSGCKFQIESAYNLLQTCIESHRRLREMLTVRPAVMTKQKKNEIHETIDTENKLSYTQTPSSYQINELDNNKQISQKMRKPRKYRCEKCSSTMNRPNSLKKHMKLKHSGEIHFCTSGSCDEVFFSEKILEEHKLFHETGLRHACKICQKRCKSLYYLREHMHSHTGELPYLCPECGKAFSNKPSLRQHLVRHSNEKAFVCEQCPSKFHTKGALKVHMLTHTKEKKFPCGTCGAKFNLKHALFSHIMVHTNERPHGCNICDMRFRTTDHLKRHIRTHTGEKPYKCAACDRAFAQSNDLVKHSKTHFGENPYQCDRCDASFRLITDLRNHYKVHFLTAESEKTDTKQDKNYQQSAQNCGGMPDVINFTIVSTLNRRAEKEKKMEVKQFTNTQKDVEMVQTILVGLSEFPKENNHN